MKHLRKSILTLLALTLFGGAGAWAQTEENIFQYCYDCQRSPAYPKTTASATLSGFANPYVGYNGSGNTSAGPWKLEYMGIWSTTNQYEIDDIWYYQDTYNCTDVPVFRLYQWNATANEYQHAAYGVVCAYANVSNAVEHTAFFEAEGGWGCVLTNSSHSSSMNITFDEDLTTGLTTIIAAAGSPAIELTPNATGKVWTLGQTPDYDLELQVEYYEAHALKDIPAGWQILVNGHDSTSSIVEGSLNITETDTVTLIPDNPRRVKSVTLEDEAPATVLGGALVDGATIKVYFKWRDADMGDYVQGVYNAASGTFTASKGGNYWGRSNNDSRAVYKVEKSGDNIIIGAGFYTYNGEAMVWTFNTTNDTYTTTNGSEVNADPGAFGLISVTLNGTDITSQLTAQ